MWQDLLVAMEEMTEAYKQLFSLSQKKRKALVSVDLSALEKLLQEEEKLTAAVNRAEQKRRGILRRLAEADERLTPDSRLEDLCSSCPSLPMAQQLRHLHAALGSMVTKLQEAGGHNEVLIRGALSAVNYRLNQLGGSAVQPAYGMQGQEIVSHKKNFDIDV